MLKKLGYEAVKTAGRHVLYKHTRKQSVLAVKHSRKSETVPKVVIASIVRNVVNTKVASENQIEEVAESLQS
jgi:predicted RNA binding protein YcfA (HicA-like mRNA interferase family)